MQPLSSPVSFYSCRFISYVDWPFHNGAVRKSRLTPTELLQQYTPCNRTDTDVQSWSALCPERLHWGRFCLGGCGIPPPRVITEQLIRLCSSTGCCIISACVHTSARANTAPTTKAVHFALELIHLVRLDGRREKGFEVAYLHIGAASKKKFPLECESCSRSHKHTHCCAQTRTDIAPEIRNRRHQKAPQRYPKSIKCFKSSPHLWTRGKKEKNSP